MANSPFTKWEKCVTIIRNKRMTKAVIGHSSLKEAKELERGSVGERCPGLLDEIHSGAVL